MAVVVGEATAVACVEGTVVAAEGAAKGVDEDGWTVHGEPIVVAVGSIVTPAYLWCQILHLVDALQQVYIGRGLTTVGVDDHDAVVPATEEVDVNQKLYLREFYQRMLSKIARAHEAALLAAE